MSTRPCMGGFCGRRSSCPHYESPTNRVAPAERLCDPGVDGVRDGQPIRVERSLSRANRALPSQVLHGDVGEGVLAW